MKRTGLVVMLAAVAVVSGFARSALAQEHPVVFLHGLNSSPGAWEGSAGRLGQRLNIAPYRPALDWRQSYATQADALAPYAGLPAQRTIAVGHSNGGIVAREWSRRRAFSGIVTVGTPHAGAPLVTRFGEWSTFAGATSSYVGMVAQAFGRPSSTSWVVTNVAPLMSWALGYGRSAVIDLAATLAMDLRLPVMTDMRPGSTYLTALNASANLTREASAVPRRVGIVSVANNYYWAGPMRAVAPEAADAVATALYGAIAGLDFWGAWILANSAFGDAAAIQQAQALFSLSAHLASIDPVYCWMVSSVSLNQCVPNDGVVPHTSQRYPNALNIVLGTDGTWGPAHIRMTRETDDTISRALTEVMQVPLRSATPAPPSPPPSSPSPGNPSPSPPPSPSPSPSPSPTPPSVQTDRLMPGDKLRPGEWLTSGDTRFDLVYQGDGNLVLYRNGVPLWATGTHGRSTGMVVMQHDGNFVMYDANNVPIWTSVGSLGHEGAWLIVQNDGNVVIYSRNGQPLWATNTVQ